MSELSRRSFLAFTGVGTLGLFVTDTLGASQLVAEAAVPSVRPASEIPLFAQNLLLPPTMPTRGKVQTPQGSADFYDLAIRQFTQQMLPDGPKTTVWGYGPANTPARQFVTPSATIRAERNKPVRVRWRNELVDTQGRYLPHLFAVDPSLHWANVPQEPGHGGVVSTDIKPDFAGKHYVRPEAFSDPHTQYTAYDGPVPIVPHLHGAKAVSDHSDGYSEAWFLPKAKNTPDGYATHGRWWEYLSERARDESNLNWGEGFVEYQYPNGNRASTLWYHDHAMGMTRLNVYAGPAGFYIINDKNEHPVHKKTGKLATMPHQIHERYELNLGIQDRSFNSDGSLFYPDSREWFDPGYTDGPWYPEAPGIPPIWVPEVFGNAIIVNGRVWPRHTVQKRRYTVRLLNGCNARTIYADLRSIPGIKAHIVASDQGYLREPVDVMAQENWREGRIVIAPAERFELVLDFTNVPVGRHILKNVGPDGYFAGGEPGVDFQPADPKTTGNILAFDVITARGKDKSTPATDLVLPALPTPPPAKTVRRLATTMHFHHLSTQERPLDPPFVASATMMGVIHGEPGGEVHIQELMWSDAVTEHPEVGDTEDWVIYNVPQEVGIPHPIHIHEAPFEVIERGTFSYEYTDHYSMGVLKHTGTLARTDLENGQQDTTFVPPGEYAVLRMTFSKAGQYMWHCHLLEHEDNEMMRPFHIGPVPANQPAPIPHHSRGHGGHSAH